MEMDMVYNAIIETNRQTWEPVDSLLGLGLAKRQESAMDAMDTRSAIRAKCLDCCGGKMNGKDSVEECDGKCVGVKELIGVDLCPLHPYRMRSNGSDGKRLKAIRLNCIWCMGGNGRTGEKGKSVKDYVSECGVNGGDRQCPLYSFRFGKNPNRAGHMSEATREKKRQFMRELRRKQIEGEHKSDNNKMEVSDVHG